MVVEDDDIEITPALRAYLDQFDAWLLDPSPETFAERRRTLHPLVVDIYAARECAGERRRRSSRLSSWRHRRRVR